MPNKQNESQTYFRLLGWLLFPCQYNGAMIRSIGIQTTSNRWHASSGAPCVTGPSLSSTSGRWKCMICKSLGGKRHAVRTKACVKCLICSVRLEYGVCQNLTGISIDETHVNLHLPIIEQFWIDLLSDIWSVEVLRPEFYRWTFIFSIGCKYAFQHKWAQHHCLLIAPRPYACASLKTGSTKIHRFQRMCASAPSVNSRGSVALLGMKLYLWTPAIYSITSTYCSAIHWSHWMISLYLQLEPQWALAVN